MKLSLFANRQPDQNILDLEWRLAPQLDPDILTDVNGDILAIGDAISHIDGELKGYVYNIDFSPFFGEEHLLMAYVIWDLGDEGTASDWIAGYLLKLA